jgi:hypothetical protein
LYSEVKGVAHLRSVRAAKRAYAEPGNFWMY